MTHTKRLDRWLVPDHLHDQKPMDLSKFPAFSTHPAWGLKRRRKYRGTRHVPGNPEPLNRHDFPARRTWMLPKTRLSDNAVVVALAMGKNNHHSLIENYWLRTEFYLAGPPVILTLKTALTRARTLGAIEEVYSVRNYDELIGAVNLTGPVILTLPWHKHFLSEDALNFKWKRATLETAEPILGMSTMLLVGYSANGMLAEIAHLQDWGGNQTFFVSEADLVTLLNISGQALALDRTNPKNNIWLYRHQEKKR